MALAIWKLSEEFHIVPGRVICLKLWQIFFKNTRKENFESRKTSFFPVDICMVGSL